MTIKMRLKVKNTSRRYGINNPRPRHGRNMLNIKWSQYTDSYVLSNT